jgi:membrane protein required for colicin V production
MVLTVLDWILLAMLGLSVLIGLWRGLIEEVMSLGGWFIAGAAALYLADSLTPLLASAGLSDTWRYILALVIIFVAVLIVWSLLTSAIKKAIGAIGLGLFDRLLGAAFGVARGVLLLTFFVMLLGFSPISQTDFWIQSKTVPLCQQVAAQLKPYLPASAAKLIP